MQLYAGAELALAFRISWKTGLVLSAMQCPLQKLSKPWKEGANAASGGLSFLSHYSTIIASIDDYCII